MPGLLLLLSLIPLTGVAVLLLEVCFEQPDLEMHFSGKVL